MRKLHKFRTFFYWRLMFREWFEERVAPHLPKIPTQKPEPPANVCGDCEEPLKIFAVDTGDGWCFYWDCENGCEYFEEPIVDWFPFVFGWATSKDLRRVGIEVV